MPRIRIEGDILDHHSLSNVNRELALGLEEAGWDVVVRQNNNLDRIDRDGDERALRIYPMLDKEGKPDIVLRHSFPPNLGPTPENVPLVFMQPWEYGSMPREWRYGWARGADKLIVYSSYIKEMYMRDKLPVPIDVIPIGVNSSFLTNEKEMEFEGLKQRPRILYVGGSIQRKGADLVISAFDEIAEETGAVLLFKDHPFYNRDMSNRIEQCRGQYKYLRHYLSPNQMPELYRSADIFVFPSRGEGFGLPVLEAMASGLIVVSVDHTGCGDFFDKSVGFVIPSEKKDIPISGVETVTQPYMYEPYDVAKVLREAISQIDTYDVDPAFQRASKYEWSKLIPKYVESLSELLHKQPVYGIPAVGSRKIGNVPALVKEGGVIEAAETERDNAYLWTAASEEASKMGKHSAAVSMLNRAIELMPDNPVLLFNRAVLRLKTLSKTSSKTEVRAIVEDLLRSYELKPSPTVSQLINKVGLPTKEDQERYDAIVRSIPKRKTLSVVMIVRNEEENIRRSIGSVKGLGDEICVVDTGSTDKTVEILHSLGVKVQERPDLYDSEKKRLRSFADARNASIDMATGDYIFWIDADDEVPSDTAAMIRGAIDDGVEAISLPVSCPQVDEHGRRSENVVRHYRVFPNDPKVRFAGAIHEQVAPSIVEAGYRISMIDTPILHHGYLVLTDLEKKYERNLSFLLEEDDGKDWTGFNLMTTYLLMGDRDRAIEIGEERLPLLDYTHAHAGKYLSTLSAAHISRGDHARGEEISLLAIEHGLNLVEQYFNLGGIYLNRTANLEDRQKNLEKAEYWMKKALDAPVACHGGAVDADAGFSKPYEALVQIYKALGNAKEAKNCLLQLLSRYYDIHLHSRLLQAYNELGYKEEFARHNKYFRKEADGDVQKRTEEGFRLIDEGSYVEGIKVLESICVDIPSNPIVTTNLGIGCLKVGELDRAYQILDTTFPVYSNPQSLYHLANVHRLLGKYETAAVLCEVGLQLNVEDPLFHLEMAYNCMALGRPDLCLKELEITSMLGSSSKDMLVLAANCQLDLEHPAEALEMARRSYEQDPSTLVDIERIYDAILTAI